MFVASSNEYDLNGFDKDLQMWRFDRKPSIDCTKQITYINRAKFIDKASGLVYFLDEEGTKSLTYRSRNRMETHRV